MFFTTPHENIPLYCSAFESAWLTLLSEERVTAENIAHLPSLLMKAVLDSALLGERDFERLASAALQRLEFYEKEAEGMFVSIRQ